MYGLSLCVFFLRILSHPPTFQLFPYTTLFRSRPTRFGAEYCCNSCEMAEATGTPPIHDGPCDEHHSGNVSIGESGTRDRKSTRLNSSHPSSSYAVFCLKKKKQSSTHTYP